MLLKELRRNGHFKEMYSSLSQRQSIEPAIPKRIVQYWNKKIVPVEIEEIAMSWKNLNPGFEYKQFNFSSAGQFIYDHYGGEVFKTFRKM